MSDFQLSGVPGIGTQNAVRLRSCSFFQAHGQPRGDLLQLMAVTITDSSRWFRVTGNGEFHGERQIGLAVGRQWLIDEIIGMSQR